jgi:hypothetical protein
MAKYSRKEFVEKLCGVEYSDSWKAKVSMWVKRGNIDVGNDGLIDDSNHKNRDWAIKQYEANVGEAEDDGTEDVEESKPKSRPNHKPTTDSGGGDNEAGYVLVKKKTLRQIEKLESDIRIANLKEEKIRGEVVPIDLIKNVFTAHSQSIITANKDGIEELIINFSKEVSLTGVQIARLRGKMIDILNNASDKAVEASKKNLKNLVEEFSIKKEVGEHG